MIDWISDHPGISLAITLGTATLISLAIGITGHAVGDNNLGDAGLGIAMLFGLSGWLIRIGYRIARAARNDDDTVDQIDEQLRAIRGSVDEPNADNVRHLRTRRSSDS